jgi:BASS family bile acid:Na+ symporter
MILLAVKASLALTVFAVGLQATSRDVTYLLRHPALLVRSFVSMNVVMPLLALWAAIVFDLHPAVKLALITLAMSPVPPFLPGRAMKAGGAASYTVGLFATASLLAIIVIPASMWLLGRLFAVPFHMPASVVARIVTVTVLVPLAAGIVVRHYLPTAAARFVKPVALIATLMLIGGLIPLFVHVWPDIKLLLGNGTLLAIIALTFVGLAMGHILGGPSDDNRTVLALATASRHPAVAIAIASTNFPGEKLVVAAVLLDLIVSAVASAPYTAQSRRQALARTSMRYTSKPVARTAQRSATLHVERSSDRRR